MPVQNDIPGGSVEKESTCNARDKGSIPASGRSSGEGNGNPLQYFYLRNHMYRENLQTKVYGVKKKSDWS